MASVSLLKSSFFMLFRVWRNMFSVRSMCFLLRSFKKYSPNIGRFSVVRLFLLVENGSSICFFRVHSCNFFMCACFFLFVYKCARMCAYTRPREIHNVGLFPSVFESIKKRSHATVLFTVFYKKNFKFSAKKSVIKVAGLEKVRTFATAFERESRWEWQNGKERQTCWRRCTRVSYLAGTQGSEKRISPDESSWKTFSKKTSKKIGGKEKTPYLCKRFPPETGAQEKIVLWKTLDKQTKM